MARIDQPKPHPHMQTIYSLSASRRARAIAVTLGLCASSLLRAQMILNYYSFDSGTLATSGSNILLASGTGNTLAAFGGNPTVDAAGKFGGAANFSSGRLDTSAFRDGATPLGNSFSISFWMKTADVTATSQSYVLQTGGESSPQSAILFGYVSGKAELYGGSDYTGPDDPRPISGITLAPALNNQWFNVVYTYDGTTLKGYLNGNQEFSTSASFSLEAAGGLSIGGSRHTNPVNAALVPGSLDDVAIFSGALSPSQVTFLQTSPANSLVPEPGEYAALAGATLIVFAAWRRRKAATT
jgi:hypothetical protein